MEISKHPEMGRIVEAIRTIAKEFPCENCKILTDDLNAAKSRLKHWKDQYDALKSALSEFVHEVDNHEGDSNIHEVDILRDFFDQVKKTIDDV